MARCFLVLTLFLQAMAQDVSITPVGQWPNYSLGESVGVALEGPFAYVATHGALHVIDISDPVTPVRLGGVDLLGTGHGLALSGTYAYVVESGFNSAASGYLQVIDVSNPTNPMLVGAIDWTESEESTHAVAVAGDYAYAGTSQYVSDTSRLGLRVIDIRNPVHPQLAGLLEIHGHNLSGQTLDVSAAKAVWGTGDEVQVLDISNASNPVLAGSFEHSPGEVNLTVSDSHAYLAQRLYERPGGRLRIINVSDRFNPHSVGSVETLASIRFVDQVGSHVYVTGELLDTGTGRYRGLLEVIDVSDRVQPRRVGGVFTSPDNPDENAFDVRLAVSDRHACVAETYHNFATDQQGSRLQVIDISNPASPHRVGSLQLDGSSAYGLAVSGSYAYVTAGGGMDVIDFSDPTNPELAGRFQPSYSMFKIVVKGHRAYVGYDGGAGVQILDISNPANFLPLGRLSVAQTRDFSLSGNHVFVIRRTGLLVFDISDPVRPRQVGQYLETEVWNVRIRVSGDDAYVARPGEFGLQIFHLGFPLTEVRLTVGLAGDQLRLRWPSSATDFLLESCASPLGTTWDPVAGTPQQSGDDFELAVPTDDPARYFRLRKP